LKLEYVVKTDVGQKRTRNEDSYGVFPEENLFFVCDGMGGHAAGDYASNKTVETIGSLIKKYHSGDLNKIILQSPPEVPLSGRMLSTSVMLANKRLFNLAFTYPKLRGMGTTFAGVLFDEGFVNIVNVGDSRIYRYRQSGLEQLSIDHSWVEELRQDGEISEYEVNNFRESNVITRALGTGSKVKVDWLGSDMKDGDIFLLCSDGLCGEIDDSKITDIIANNKEDLNNVATELVNAANNAGGSDNITVVLVRVNGEISKDPNVKYNEISTLSNSAANETIYNNYSNKIFPVRTTEVPKGVTREKTKIYRNPIVFAVFMVFILFGAMILSRYIKEELSKPIVTKLAIGDIIIRTIPADADIKLYSKNTLLKELKSPAMFPSLEQGVYKVEIEKIGYEKRTLIAYAYESQQNIKEERLVPKGTIKIELGMFPGFNPEDKIYIDDEAVKYAGQDLTVRDIGTAGKEIASATEVEHVMKIGDFTKKFRITGPSNKIRFLLHKKKVTDN
jgi:protein phosphatase